MGSDLEIVGLKPAAWRKAARSALPCARPHILARLFQDPTP
jgi:hypothetical protein